ncbi:hypothetical protein OE88DRAFT_1656428 [Heliocybe sulcata]|uniref:Uncharacterized protein n=1 Tax=Heliocybe sulcata TaxID=5364 RepID=A0A5C3N4U4_9AGAM|nr:hypothetical protein OE88DRAFT_1656428 [Heliocybe sulcata]
MSLSILKASEGRRASLASAVSDLRRVRPRVPFWELGAHRVPTLWTLYRGLLKEAPALHIRNRIQRLFRDKRSLNSPRAAKEQLVKGHRWLDIFRRAKEGDERLQRVLDRYNRLLAIRSGKEHWRDLLLDAKAYQEKLRRRPIMTGSFIRPSIFNRALPRLSPQPDHITGMIAQRKHSRAMRMEKAAVYAEYQSLMREEGVFERLLQEETERYEQDFEPIFEGHMVDWRQPIQNAVLAMNESYRLDAEREASPYPPELVEMVRNARREKIANKTRERERERRGEVLACTVRRMRKGPPAHVAIKMTEEQKRLDKASRSPSEVGYVAIAKRKLGHKLRNPEAWKVEIGRDEDQERFHEEVLRIEKENERRARAEAEASDIPSADEIRPIQSM